MGVFKKNKNVPVSENSKSKGLDAEKILSDEALDNVAGGFNLTGPGAISGIGRPNNYGNGLKGRN